MSPQYDWRAMFGTATEHDARANAHRPTDQAAIQREVQRLHAQGLRPRDIATALGLNDAFVLELIPHHHDHNPGDVSQ